MRAPHRLWIIFISHGSAFGRKKRRGRTRIMNTIIWHLTLFPASVTFFRPAVYPLCMHRGHPSRESLVTLHPSLSSLVNVRTVAYGDSGMVFVRYVGDLFICIVSIGIFVALFQSTAVYATTSIVITMHSSPRRPFSLTPISFLGSC